VRQTWDDRSQAEGCGFAGLSAGTKLNLWGDLSIVFLHEAILLIVKCRDVKLEGENPTNRQGIELAHLQGYSGLLVLGCLFKCLYLTDDNSGWSKFLYLRERLSASPNWARSSPSKWSATASLRFSTTSSRVLPWATTTISRHSVMDHCHSPG
jgi:hypothetical protein